MTDRSSAPSIVVRDDRSCQVLIQDTLETAGLQIILSASHSEALSVVEGAPGKIAGLVTDINRGGQLSGWDIANEGRKLDPGLLVVYMTGDSAQQWPFLGVPDSIVVTKPFAPGRARIELDGAASTGAAAG